MIGAAVLLYACNKLWFLPAASGPLRLFLAWYFSDLLAGALLLALVELLLVLGGCPPYAPFRPPPGICWPAASF